MQYGKEVRSETAASVAWSPMSWLFSAMAPADVTKIVTSSTPPVSPIENMMRGFTQSGNPWLNAYAQASMELVSFATRRSQALMTLPVQAIQCKTPMDVIALQIRHGQNAVQHYVESTRRVASAWSAVTPVAAQFSRTLETATLKQVPVVVKRDRIVIEEPKPEPVAERIKTAETSEAPAPSPAASKPRQGGGDRRSAA